MPAIARDSLLTLEAYAKERSAFRARVLAHKRNRIVHLGPHVTLLFEDELTIRYQIQEMLRIEKTFDESGIQQEVDAYNPLVPDGSNLKATMLLEYEDVDERKLALSGLKGIEDRVWVQVKGFPKVFGDDRSLQGGHARCAQHRPPELPGRGRHDLAARAGNARLRLRLTPSAAEKGAGARAC